MSKAYERIKNYERVIETFGHWPDFHDAEVHSLALQRIADPFQDIVDDVQLDLCLHAFEWTHDPKPVFNHHLVQLRFHGIDELVLTGFNYQNAILGFRFEDYVPQPDRPVQLKLTFIHAFGLAGSFCAGDGEVIAITPCDDKGKART